MIIPDRLQQIEDLFHSALQLSRADRAEFLAQSCGVDQGLLREVNSLLAAHDSPDNSLVTPTPDNPPASLPPVPPQTIQQFQIISLLGKGGMGEVYLAADTKLDRPVALKILPEKFTANPDLVLRFEREAKAVSALNHPNILTVYEIGQTENFHFIVTEFISGETLRQRIKGGMMPLSEVLEIMTQIAAALAAAHEAGIIHRDIKPENIMIRPDGYVKVLDFGLAKLAENSSQPPAENTTQTGTIMGTPAYMSPEQARGERVDFRADLWSLGVISYELLAGQRPFEGKSQAELLVSILEREPPPLPAHIPAELHQIVTRLLAKVPESRSDSPTELLQNLKTLRQQNVLDNSETTTFPTMLMTAEQATQLLQNEATQPLENLAPSSVLPAAQAKQPDSKNKAPHLITHRRSEKKLAIIFVHGFGGKAGKTWGEFPQFLLRDARLAEWDIFSLGYASNLSFDVGGIWAADPQIDLLSEFFQTALANYPLGNYAQIVLVAHSMGGLVVQRALLNERTLTNRVSHLFLYATPSAGLEKASLFSLLKRQVRDLASDSSFIKTLRQEWTAKFGERPPFYFISIAGDRDEFVPASSSFTLFPSDLRAVIPGNHIQLVKPKSHSDLSVQLLLKGILGDTALESVILSPTLQPKSKLTAAGASHSPWLKPLLVAGCLGILSLGGWMFWRPATHAPTNAPIITQPVAPMAIAPPATYSLTWWLQVQRRQNGRLIGKPIQSNGRDWFPNGSQLKFYLSGLSNGYLYLLNEGLTTGQVKSLNLLYPTPKNNNRDAAITANQVVETGNIYFDENEGTEQFWIVWGQEPLKEIEAAKTNANPEIKDATQREAILKILQQAAPGSELLTNDEQEKVQVRGGSVIAQLVRLKHQ